MNGRCETCSAEKVCAYPYKPTECANQRKFEMHPDAVDCPNCNGADKGRDCATEDAERRNNRLRAFAESGLIDGLAVRPRNARQLTRI